MRKREVVILRAFPTRATRLSSPGVCERSEREIIKLSKGGRGVGKRGQGGGETNEGKKMWLLSCAC